MEKIKIQIVKLGKQKHDDIFNKLKKYKSNMFVVEIFERSLPQCDNNWGYTFNTLGNILEKAFDSNRFDMCIGFIDTEIEKNYFGKRLKEDNIFVASFYEVDEMLKKENIDIFNFMKIIIYRYLTRYIVKGKIIVHDETRGCIFDMCGYKQNIIYSCQKPCICDECKTKIMCETVPNDFMTLLSKETGKIKKTLYYRVSNFIKMHPYISIFIGTIVTIILNIISNFLFEILKKVIGMQ